MSIIFINPYRFAASVAYDADAQAYITAVEAADGQALETAVKDAINALVVGCKTDGIWNAIKASCILVGARTLNGALVPLVGTAPTNTGFVSADYNRKTGLKGEASSTGTKWLNTNRANNADPQNNRHMACFPTELSSDVDTNPAAYMGTSSAAGGSFIRRQAGSSTLITRFNASSDFTGGTDSVASTLKGLSRSDSAAYIVRSNGVSTTASIASSTPASASLAVFRRGVTGATFPTRIAFYSIGESLDLALLDARVTTLINDLAAAIP